jgi:4,5-dihydroxyphthalate decarboxylase
MAVTINIAFGDNPRIMPLKDGTVKPEGIDLNWLDVGSAWIFHRNLYNDEFDASENSISSTLLAMDMRSGGKWDWWGLPIFMSSGGLAWVETMHVNTNSGVNGLGDIKGKKIAAPDYEMTLALWMKIVMKDMHNIDAKDNVWYNGRTRELSRDDALGLVDNPPPGVERHWLTEDQYMDTMLDRGELDVSYIPRPSGRTGGRPPGYTVTMERWGGTQIDGNPRIRPLFPDRGRAIMAEYHRRFGHYHQPNHHVVIQKRITDKYPWVPLELVKAFQRSKEIAYQRAREAYEGYFLFEGSDYQNQIAAYGEDAWPLGLTKMGKTIERMVQGSLEQGLMRHPLKLSDIYHPATLDT